MLGLNFSRKERIEKKKREGEGRKSLRKKEDGRKLAGERTTTLFSPISPSNALQGELGSKHKSSQKWKVESGNGELALGTGGGF